MDARPQRPLRGLRVLPDENIAPTGSAKQTLHQRHKSTGTLTSMLTTGGLKAAAKRTAFGDVSNTVKNMNAPHDDSVIGSKQTIGLVKPAPHEKSAAFLRPAQRPLNPVGAKIASVNNSSTSTESNAAHIAPKAPAPLLETRQAPAVKRALSKKATAIYKDVEVENSVSQGGASIDVPGEKIDTHAAGIEQEQDTTCQTQSNSLGHKSSQQAEIVTSNTTYEDAAEKQNIASDQASKTYLDPEIQQDQVQGGALLVERQQRQLPAPPGLVSEPEEYWEDEEHEVYDEQGYTTAHSYRSHGENTTGGVTTVVFPRVTGKILKELALAKEVIESSRTIEEIEDEAWDTSMVAEYGDEIFGYMRELEIKMLPNPDYMAQQTEIQWSMRSVLMDWLIQVHHRFSLLPETLFLCVNYIDRFLSCKIVSLGKLQLVGATAIFVAAKYEEINCPSVNEIVYMVDGGYTVDEILKAERFMLTMLQFELGWPGPMSFLRRISKADDYDLETRTLAKYFLEITIMDERFVGSPPSYVAAGAHFLARFMLGKGDWTHAHIYYSGYTWTQLRPLVSMIKECCASPLKHHSAVFEKYQDRRYRRASLYVQGEMQKGFTLPPAHVSRLSLPPIEDPNAPFDCREPFKRMVQVKG